jgi:hypothetical protein
MSETRFVGFAGAGLTGDGMASQLMDTLGGIAGKRSVLSASRRSPAAPNDVTGHRSDSAGGEAARPLRADRVSFQRRFVARIEAAALELGEYLRPPISTISIITSVCERLTMWAGSDGRHGPDAAIASFDRHAEAKRDAVEQPLLPVDAHARHFLPPHPVACGSSPSSQNHL